MARLLSALLCCAFALSVGSGVAAAKQCRDAKTGKFVKCPASSMGKMKMTSSKSCKDPKTGKFVKCKM